MSRRSSRIDATDGDLRLMRWGAPGPEVLALLFDDDEGTLRLVVGRALKLARE